MPRTALEFVNWLADRHRDVAALLADHLIEFDGELLEHVLFAHITRHASDLARRAPEEPEADAKLQRLLEDLDPAILPVGEDDPVDNVVWVSFVENASGVPGDDDEPLRERLRAFPNLAYALRHYE